MPDTLLSSYGINTIITYILQKRKPRHRQTKKLVLGSGGRTHLTEPDSRAHALLPKRRKGRRKKREENSLRALSHSWVTHSITLSLLVPQVCRTDNQNLTIRSDLTPTTSRKDTAPQSSTRLWIGTLGTFTLTGSSEFQSTWISISLVGISSSSGSSMSSSGSKALFEEPTSVMIPF